MTRLRPDYEKRRPWSVLPPHHDVGLELPHIESGIVERDVRASIPVCIRCVNAARKRRREAREPIAVRSRTRCGDFLEIRVGPRRQKRLRV